MCFRYTIEKLMMHIMAKCEKESIDIGELIIFMNKNCQKLGEKIVNSLYEKMITNYIKNIASYIGLEEYEEISETKKIIQNNSLLYELYKSLNKGYM